ncbi:hypothetical protein VNO77_27177 [Canavalia gladiata]|uniref:Uncharacterized protein n=1 Tax=Canavalia gladiata TaxID=3824 RepID=A0AAN9Q3Y9_CANGL
MISLYSSSSLPDPNSNPKSHTNTKYLLFLLAFIFFTASFLFYLFSTHNHNSQSRLSFLSNICICSISPLEGHPQASPLPASVSSSTTATGLHSLHGNNMHLLFVHQELLTQQKMFS